MKRIHAYLDFDDGHGQGGDFIDCHADSTTGNNAWERVGCTITTGPATTGVRIRAVTDGTISGIVWFDDIQLEAGSHVTDYSTTSYIYDEENGLERVVFSDGKSNRYVYDAEGKRVKKIDKFDITTYYVYDQTGNVIFTALQLLSHPFQNGNFEDNDGTDFNYWTKYGDASITVSTGYSGDGVKIDRATATGKWSDVYQAGIDCKPNTKYELTVKYKSDGARGGIGLGNWGIGDYDTHLDAHFSDSSGEWKEIRVPWTSKDFEKSCQVTLFLDKDSSGTIWFDDAELIWIDPNGVIWSESIRITTDLIIDERLVYKDERPSIIEFVTYGILEKYVLWHSWRPLVGGDDIYPKIWYKISADPDGASWTHAILLTAEGANYRPAPARVTKGSSRELWVTWSSNRPGSVGYDIYYKYFYESSPFVWVWSDDIRLAPLNWGPSDYLGDDQDPSIIQTSDGNIWSAWCARKPSDPNYDIYLAKYDGTNWRSFPIIAKWDDGGNEMYPSMIQKDGNIWIAYHSDKDGDNEIYYVIYNPAADTFFIPSNSKLTDNSVPDMHPSIMQKKNSGIWIAWDRVITASDFEVYYTFTSDQGITWTPEVDISLLDADDKTPWITQTTDKRVLVTWASDRDGNLEIYAMYGVQPEITPPAIVTNLATSAPTTNSITLTWSAPGDDGNIGTALQYDIRYSTSRITEDNWEATTQCEGEPTPKAAGSPESFTVISLSRGTTYYFALKTADEVPNWSPLSNIASGTTLLFVTPRPTPMF